MEQLKSVCKNPWCKATFFYTEKDLILNKDYNEKNPSSEEPQLIAPNECPKCKSFDNDLSGGVSWTEKKYEGSVFDSVPHQIRYKVTNYK